MVTEEIRSGAPSRSLAIDFLADQLEIADPSCVKKYALRQETHREHAGKIRKALKLKDFSQVEADLSVFAGGRAWVTGDGPKAIFADAVGWLRERDVLLPGVSRLARLVARERDAATQRLWDTLYAALTGQQRREMDALLVVPPGSRVSELERWRVSPARASGPQMVKVLHTELHEAAHGLADSRSSAGGGRRARSGPGSEKGCADDREHYHHFDDGDDLTEQGVEYPDADRGSERGVVHRC